MSDVNGHADPLVWGHGEKSLEIFLEPTCPHSVRAFDKLDELLDAVGPDKMRLRIWLLSQPWHLFSGIVVRCVFAASTLPAGKEAAKQVLAAVGRHREEFEFENHAGGPNMDATPNEIIERLEAYCGLGLKEPFVSPGLEREVKRHCKYARQNGIHFSPTFMVDGLIDPEMNSGDEVSSWARALGRT